VINLDGGEWSASRPRRSIPAKIPRYPLYVSQSRSGLFEEEENPLLVLGIKAQFLVLSSPQSSLYWCTLSWFTIKNFESFKLCSNMHFHWRLQISHKTVFAVSHNVFM